MKSTNFFISVIFLLVTFTFAEPLRVDVFVFPPLAIEQDGQFSGIEIDIWKKIAADNGYDYVFNKVDKFSNIFDGLKSGEADVALAGITITSDREKFVDFSQSHMSSGLGVLCNKSDFSSSKIIKSNIIFYKDLIKSLIPYIIAWISYVYVIAFILWLLERKSELFNHDMKDGWMDAKFFVHVVMSSTGFGNQIPVSKWGKRVTVLIMYSGIGFMFPLITSKIFSEMQKKAPEVYISTIEDLKDKKVAVIEGTTSVGFVKKVEGIPIPVSNTTEAIQMLKANKCNAMVYDKPALTYYEKSDTSLFVIRDTFNIEDYGIAVQNKSELLEDINTSILEYKETNVITDLKTKWF
jgi:polar amino acid transport system substrate-binding protein